MERPQLSTRNYLDTAPSAEVRAYSAQLKSPEIICKVPTFVSRKLSGARDFSMISPRDDRGVYSNDVKHCIAAQVAYINQLSYCVANGCVYEASAKAQSKNTPTLLC